METAMTRSTTAVVMMISCSGGLPNYATLGPADVQLVY